MAKSTATDTMTATAERRAGSDYDMPFVHLRVPQRVGNAAFWLGVAGAVAGGVIEAPVALLVAAGVVVVRHRSGATRP